MEDVERIVNGAHERRARERQQDVAMKTSLFLAGIGLAACCAGVIFALRGDVREAVVMGMMALASIGGSAAMGV